MAISGEVSGLPDGWPPASGKTLQVISEAPVPIGMNVAPICSTASCSGIPPTKKLRPKPMARTVSGRTPSDQYTRAMDSIQMSRSWRVMPT